MQESRVSTISSVIRAGQYLSEKDADEALIGKFLAKSLEVDIGDELTLLGYGLDDSIVAGMVKIKGIFSSGDTEFDRSSLIMPLTTFQNNYSMGKAIHEIVIISTRMIRLSHLIKSLKQQLAQHGLSQHLVVVPWQQLLPGLEQAIKIDMVNGWIFYAILVVIVCLSIMNTFFMSVMERTKEFGMLLAVGMSHKLIARLVLVESIFMTAAGVGLGVLFGGLFTYYFQVYGIEFSGYSELFAQWGMSSILRPKISLISLLIMPSLVLLITLLIICLPLLKIYRLTPIKAMRAG